jgi:hypothetical protein
MANITDVFSENADSRSLAPAAVGSQVGLMLVVSVCPSMPFNSMSSFFTLHSRRIVGHHYFIQHPSPEQQSEQFYHIVPTRAITTFAIRSFMSQK